MDINSKELQDYLKASLAAIKNGVEGSGDFIVEESIEFNIAVTNVQEGGWPQDLCS